VFLYSFGEFKNAQSISVDPGGMIYIADAGDHKIKEFTSEGKMLLEVGGYGWGSLEFDQPVDICALFGIDIYVSDFGNHRVQRFDRNLTYVSTFATRNDPVEGIRFGYPSGVTISRLGDLYISDGENHRVLKVNSFSSVERTFGGFDAGKGRLVQPGQIEVDEDNLVYVSDGIRVVVYDSFGNFVRIVGEGALDSLRGICLSEKTLLAVSGSKLFVFDEKGERHLRFSPPEGIGVGEARNPRDVAVYKGKVYLLGSTRVDVFELL
jgi:hypothetical protein